jgi:hypothetical protein
MTKDEKLKSKDKTPSVPFDKYPIANLPMMIKIKINVLIA